MKELNDMTLREITKAYYESVTAIAKEIASEFKLEGPYAINDNEAADTRLQETIDASEWVIYTFRAQLVALLSDNNDAHLECYPEEEAISPETVAYFAMQADVLDLLNNEYFFKDLNEKKVA